MAAVQDSLRHVQHLQSVADEDVRELRRKEQTYRGSWKRRGGVGAFMMLARKWDRLEGMVQAHPYDYDVFTLIGHGTDGSDGSALAEIRDLRRYLLLVESEMIAAGTVAAPTPPAAASAPTTFTDDALTVLGQIGQNGDDRLRGETTLTPEKDLGAPWVMVSSLLSRPGLVPQAAVRMLYTSWSPETYFLEPALTPEERFEVSRLADGMPSGSPGRAFLRNALHQYTREGGWYVLRADTLPQYWRHLWPTLKSELNSKEHEELLLWQRTLYHYVEGTQKWMINDGHERWCDG